MWKDAPAALCEFVGVDPARKWAQCERERDEWAALAGQYKQERDKAREELEDWENAAAHVEADHPDEVHCSCVPVLRKLLADARKERDEAREENKKFREALEWIVERYENPAHTHQVAMDAYEMACTARAALRMEEAK